MKPDSILLSILIVWPGLALDWALSRRRNLFLVVLGVVMLAAGCAGAPPNDTVHIQVRLEADGRLHAREVVK